MIIKFYVVAGGAEDEGRMGSWSWTELSAGGRPAQARASKSGLGRSELAFEGAVEEGGEEGVEFAGGVGLEVAKGGDAGG